MLYQTTNYGPLNLLKLKQLLQASTYTLIMNIKDKAIYFTILIVLLHTIYKLFCIMQYLFSKTRNKCKNNTQQVPKPIVTAIPIHNISPHLQQALLQ